MVWYKDPLFGIIILLVIIASVGILDFLRNKMREKKRLGAIENLKKSYDYLGVKDGVEEFLKLSTNPIPTLEFIAQAYIQSGNIQEAIKIYRSIVDNLEDSQEKARILYALGIAYFQAGFLQRAKNIFLEIIKNYPRNREVLSYLLKTYENLGLYKDALDTLGCIEEICNQSQICDEKYLHEIAKNYAYLQTLNTFYDTTLGYETKIAKLKNIYSNHPQLQKLILGFYKEINLPLFWREVLNHKGVSNTQNIENLLDIFWKCTKEEVPLSLLNNPKILEIYRAKGYIESSMPCEKFELESIRVLREFSAFRADLSFEYRCSECKSIFPFESNRCPKCNALLCFELICKVIEQKNEISHSLL